MSVIAALPTTPVHPPSPAGASGPQRLTHLLLSEPGALNEELTSPERLPLRVTQLLGRAVVTFAAFGAVVGVMIVLLGPAVSVLPPAPHPWLSLPLIFAGGLTGALGLCLPVFIFCAQVSGLDASPALVAAQALRAQATAALGLQALVPLFVAVGLGTAWLGGGADAAVVLGLALPVLAGAAGVLAILRGFLDLAARQGLAKERVLPLKALVLGASAVYTLVAPVALFWLFQVLWARI